MKYNFVIPSKCRSNENRFLFQFFIHTISFEKKSTKDRLKFFFYQLHRAEFVKASSGVIPRLDFRPQRYDRDLQQKEKKFKKGLTKKCSWGRFVV